MDFGSHADIPYISSLTTTMTNPPLLLVDVGGDIDPDVIGLAWLHHCNVGVSIFHQSDTR